jgi:hypothetical protein
MFQDPNAPGGGGGWFGGGWPFGSMGQQNGLLGGGMSPAQMGLLSGFAALAQAGAPSTTPKSFAGALGQGVQGGLQGYGMGKQFEQMGEMSALRRAQMDEITRKAKAEEDMRRFRMGLMPGSNQAAASPQPSIEKSLGGPVALTPVGLEQPPQARSLEAPEPAPSNLIPVDKLQAAWANGLDIGPLLKLNEQAMPDMAYQDAGNEIVGINKRTQQVVQRIPKGAAPGSRPYEAADIDPPAYRKFLKDKTAAGSTQVHVSTEKKYGEQFAGAIAKADSEMRDAAIKAPDLADRAASIKDTLSAGKVITGMGADFRLNLGKALNLVGATDAETIANTEALSVDLARNTLDAIKASGLGSGTGFSNADRDFLEKAAGGKINLEKETISRLADLSHRAATKTAEKWNSRVKQIPDSALEGTGITRDPVSIKPLGGGAMTSMPPAAQHKDRVIEDSSGKRFKSDGMTWRPL